MDGRPLNSDDLNYVPQFDDLNEYFSPREVLLYMNTLKVPDELFRWRTLSYYCCTYFMTACFGGWHYVLRSICDSLDLSEPFKGGAGYFFQSRASANKANKQDERGTKLRPTLCSRAQFCFCRDRSADMNAGTSGRRGQETNGGGAVAYPGAEHEVGCQHRRPLGWREEATQHRLGHGVR